MDTRPGYKEALVQKNGIRIVPVGIGSPGTECKRFKIRVFVKDRQVQSKEPHRLYPLKGTKDEPGIWEKINEINEFYYNKLKSKK